MTDEHTPEPQADETPGSVFGNLPGSRPGRRSPRRTSGAAGKDKTDPKAKPQAKATPSAEAKPKARTKPSAAEPAKPPPAPRTTPSPEPAPARGRGGGIEDVAWAGIAAAAEAATLGVRLVGRAYEALRGDSQERD